MKLLKIFTKTKKIPIFVKEAETGILNGKTALITGGSSGIGFAIAKLFAKEGCSCIIAGRNETKLKEAIKSINGASYLILDISDVQKTKDVVDNIFTSKRIDILVNSAGIHNTEKFLNVTEDEFDKIMDINLKGTFFLSQEIARKMIENNIQGNILMVSSSSAKRPAWGPYHLSKWAIDGLTKGFADKLIEYGIVVNGIAPGQTATGFFDIKDDINNEFSVNGRFLLPDEIAPTALFLVSNYGRNIVGDVVYVSGGSGIVNSHK